MIAIEDILYDYEFDMYIVTLENGEKWVMPVSDCPEDMSLYEFAKEVINYARELYV